MPQFGPCRALSYTTALTPPSCTAQCFVPYAPAVLGSYTRPFVHLICPPLSHQGGACFIKCGRGAEQKQITNKCTCDAAAENQLRQKDCQTAARSDSVAEYGRCVDADPIFQCGWTCQKQVAGSTLSVSSSSASSCKCHSNGDWDKVTMSANDHSRSSCCQSFTTKAQCPSLQEVGRCMWSCRDDDSTGFRCIPNVMSQQPGRDCLEIWDRPGEPGGAKERCRKIPHNGCVWQGLKTVETCPANENVLCPAPDVFQLDKRGDITRTQGSDTGVVDCRAKSEGAEDKHTVCPPLGTIKCGDALKLCNPDGNDLSNELIGEKGGVCVRLADSCPLTCADSHKRCPAFSEIMYELKNGVITPNAPRLASPRCIPRGEECVENFGCGEGLSKCDEESVCVRLADSCPCADSHKRCPAFSQIMYELKDGVIINAPRLASPYCIPRGEECVASFGCGEGLSKCDEERRSTEKGMVAVGEAMCVRKGDPCPCAKGE